jgi:uncharacterized zinc-type alcohol dehydrogenase-like protein
MESKQSTDYSFRGQVLDGPEEADGIAWAAFDSKSGLKKVYFKHPNLGDNEVRIKVSYSGICQSDVSVIEQKIPGPSVYPIIAGHEIIGRIYQKGEKATSLKIGDLVGVGPYRDCCEKCDYCLWGRENMCSDTPMKLTIRPWFGGFSTSVQLPCTYVFKIPDGIDESLAPPLMCAGGTVFAPLRKYGKIGGKVAIIGMGGLGHLAVQFASKLGMKTYAISTSDSKKEAIMNLGAHVYVNSSDPDQMKDLMSQKIDLILNTSAASDFTGYMRALKKGSGVFVQIGAPESEIKISFVEILLNELTFTGSAAANRDDMKRMLEFSMINKIKSVNEVFNFDNFPEAYERTKKGANFRVVVEMPKTEKV